MQILLLLTLVFLLILLALVAAVAVAVGMTGWRLDLRNRVDVTRPSPAPTSWLIAPTEAASLHRRLRDLATLTRRIGPLPESATPGSTDDLRIKVLQQAALLDHDLAASSRASKRHRREALARIRPQVHELENLSRRVYELSKRSAAGNLQPGVDPPEVALSEIAERVRLLEHAEAELADVERSNGLLDAERLIRESEPVAEATPPPQPQQLPRSESQPIPTMPSTPTPPSRVGSESTTRPRRQPGR